MKRAFSIFASLAVLVLAAGCATASIRSTPPTSAHLPSHRSPYASEPPLARLSLSYTATGRDHADLLRRRRASYGSV